MAKKSEVDVQSDAMPIPEIVEATIEPTFRTPNWHIRGLRG